MADLSMTYVARCRTCNKVTMMVVDNPNRADRVARSVREAILAGDYVERVESESVCGGQGSYRFCECPHGKNPPKPMPTRPEPITSPLGKGQPR